MTRLVLNLDDQRDAIVVLTYGGLRASLSRARLEELLALEQEHLAKLTAEPAPIQVTAPKASERKFDFTARQVPQETVTHASLSTRIKKIYAYSATSRRLREAHIGLLKDLIENFDWRIPPHPSTRLEGQLVEMVGWKNVPEDFRTFVLSFVDRYIAARQRRAG